MGDLRMYEVNGVVPARETGGPATGPAVLFLHAPGEDRHTWRAVAEALAADGMRTIAVDLRGHGGSGRPGTYAFASMRDDVLGLLDLLGLDRVTLVAHSQGTFVASLVAVERPAAVRRLVLEEGPLPFPADPAGPVPDGPGPEPAPYDPRVPRDLAARRDAPPDRHLDGLAAITAPTLVIAGGRCGRPRQDRLAEVAARIPDARLVTLDAGHLVHRERPAEFLAAVRGFLGPPLTAPAAERRTAAEAAAEEAWFAALLADTVASGASVGFPGPLTTGEAAAWWRELLPAVEAGRVLLWAVREEDGRVLGTVQLHRAASRNGTHRAEIAKLMVHRDARGRGLARLLLRTAEAAATAEGIRLLVLDTETGSPAELLYRKEGWTPAGTIPDYAADPRGVLRPTTLFYKRLPAPGPAGAVPLPRAGEAVRNDRLSGHPAP